MSSTIEAKVTAVDKASSVIKNRGLLDVDFPDLRTTFNEKNNYESFRTEAVRPIVSKETIMLPTEGHESLRLFDPKTCTSGIEPSLKNTFYSVKNLLYLWDYERRTMIIHEEVDQIVGIAFVKPKPSIFVETINQLLVIATLNHIKLFATNYTSTTGLKVFNTGFQTDATGIQMTSILGTPNGRIFMLGSDHKVWELEYQSNETWFSSQCSKRLHTTSSIPLLFTLSTSSPVVQITLNQAGTVLYQLLENNTITVTDVLGDSYHTVYQYKSGCKDARSVNPRSPYLDPRTFKIVSIHPTLPTESKHYQIVAITSVGVRLYFSHYKDNQHLTEDATPNTLELIYVKDPADDVQLNDVFTNTFYNNTIFIGVKNQHEKPTEDKIITYSLDLAKIVNPINMHNKQFEYGEFNNQLNIPGKILRIAEADTTASTQINELTASLGSPSRTFLALTTFGLAVLQKQRPIDMLCTLLVNANNDTAARLLDFQSFFDYFGHVNGIAVSLGLICSVATVPDAVAEGAVELLKNLGQVPSAWNHEFTSRHDGLALFIFRAIRPVWNKPFIKTEMKDGVSYFTSNVSVDALQNTELVLRKLNLIIQQRPEVFKNTSNKEEEESIKNLSEFVSYTCEAISFMKSLLQNDLSTIVKSLKPKTQEAFKLFTLDQLTTRGGRSLASDLAYALVDYTFSKVDNTAYVIDMLTQLCSSFCGANDVLLYKAINQIHSAHTAANISQAKAILSDALKILAKIQISVDKAQEITKELASQGYHVYGVQLILDCIKQRTGDLKKPFYDIIFDLLLDVLSKYTIEPSVSKDVFQATFSICDKEFAFYIYDKFLEKRLGEVLIRESPPYLEEFFSRKPLTIEKLSLLAEYHKTRQQFEDAAKIYFDLAQNIDDLNLRIEFLCQASICAKSVTNPAKQYDIYLLNQEISELLTSSREQKNIIPVQ